MPFWTTVIAIGQDLVAGSFVSSDLHLEIVQRNSHVAFKVWARTSSNRDVSLSAVAGSCSATSRR